MQEAINAVHNSSFAHGEDGQDLEALKEGTHLLLSSRSQGVLSTPGLLSTPESPFLFPHTFEFCVLTSPASRFWDAAAVAKRARKHRAIIFAAND
jgi:hypothetical protein